MHGYPSGPEICEQWPTGVEGTDFDVNAARPQQWRDAGYVLLGPADPQATEDDQQSGQGLSEARGDGGK